MKRQTAYFVGCLLLVVLVLGGWILLLPSLATLVLSIPSVKRAAIIKPAYVMVKKILPAVSETEQAALDAKSPKHQM